MQQNAPFAIGLSVWIATVFARIRKHRNKSTPNHRATVTSVTDLLRHTTVVIAEDAFVPIARVCTARNRINAKHLVLIKQPTT